MATENDLVLIYFEDKPMSFARIEDILPDSKPDWYHVKLLLLQIPTQVVTWILRDVYINGDEFTMKRMRLEKVENPQDSEKRRSAEKREDKAVHIENSNGASVISFTDRKKK